MMLDELYPSYAEALSRAELVPPMYPELEELLDKLESKVKDKEQKEVRKNKKNRQTFFVLV